MNLMVKGSLCRSSAQWRGVKSVDAACRPLLESRRDFLVDFPPFLVRDCLPSCARHAFPQVRGKTLLSDLKPNPSGGLRAHEGAGGQLPQR